MCPCGEALGSICHLTVYTFSIEPQNANIYCGISYNFPFDLGMYGGRQFFRIRNYKDNSQPWCGFFGDLGYEYRETDVNIPADQCELGKCVQTNQGLVWGLKRYTDDQIVLQGCGDDEYIYNREENREMTNRDNQTWADSGWLTFFCKNIRRIEEMSRISQDSQEKS